MSPPFVTRVRIQSFKSIKACDVELGPLTILVGPNGSGKSNFLDAFQFTADALSTTLEVALMERGGIGEVRRRSPGEQAAIGIALDLRLDGGAATYAFVVEPLLKDTWRVVFEECVVRPGSNGRTHHFRVQDGEVSGSSGVTSPPAHDRLHLVTASSDEVFRPVFDALTAMGVYRLAPEAIRTVTPQRGRVALDGAGRNVAGVLHVLEHTHPARRARVVEYMQRIVPGLTDVTAVELGPLWSLAFLQDVDGTPYQFSGFDVSDGTLRSLGVLAALFQSDGHPPSLVAIEEPELFLHVGAMRVLIDAIREAALTTQVVITTHSPELIDRADIDPTTVLSVAADHGRTVIGPMDDVGRDVVREELFTPGELLRADQIEPSEEAHRTSQLDADQLRLFAP